MSQAPNNSGNSGQKMERASEEEIKRLLMRRYKRRNIAVGLGLAAGVFGIYAYSMLAVKQENFLDEDFDVPGPDTRTKSN